LHFSLVTFRVTKSKETKRTGHRRLIERREILTDFWRGNLEDRNHMESLGTDEMLVFKYSKEYDWVENKLRGPADTVAKFRIS